MSDILKLISGSLALALTLIAFAPYFYSIWKRRITPHAISWFIWGAGTLVVFAAQVQHGGGYGAYVIGISGILTLAIGSIALMWSADISIDRQDYVYLALATSAAPFWYITDSALAAVAILTAVDLLGFGPSVRKAHSKPHDENATFFAIGAIRNGFVILALEQYTWTTVLFPAAIGLACGMFVIHITLRRKVLGDIAKKTANLTNHNGKSHE